MNMNIYQTLMLTVFFHLAVLYSSRTGKKNKK